MAFQNYTGPVNVDFNCQVTVRNWKYGTFLMAQRDIKNIVRTPIIALAVAADKQTAALTMNFFSEPVRKYRIDNGEWQDFIGGSVTLFKNCAIAAKAINKFGAESPTVSRSLTELFHEAPVINSALIDDRTTHAVDITYSILSANRVYRLDNGNWQSYSGPFHLYGNATVYAKGSNQYGLESSVAQRALAGIVIDIPNISYIRINNNQAATISINYGNLYVKLYSFDNITWQNYSGPLTITQDATIFAKGITKGNIESTLVSRTIRDIGVINTIEWERILTASPTSGMFITWSPSLHKFITIATDYFNQNTLIIFSSTNGRQWSRNEQVFSRNIYNANLSGMLWSEEKQLYVLFGGMGTNNTPSSPSYIILTSPTGLIWTERSITNYYQTIPPGGVVSPANAYTTLSCACWSKERNLFVILAVRSSAYISSDQSSGSRLVSITSADGVSWGESSSLLMPGLSYLRAVTWANGLGKFILIGGIQRPGPVPGMDDPSFFNSNDGVAWALAYRDQSDPDRFQYAMRDVAWSPELGVVTAIGKGSGDSNPGGYWSNNAINWAKASVLSGIQNSIIGIPGYRLLVTAGGTGAGLLDGASSLFSSDGRSFKLSLSMPSATTSSIPSIAWSSELNIIVGISGFQSAGFTIYIGRLSYAES